MKSPLTINNKMQARQCIVIRGSSAWCRDTAKELLIEFDTGHIWWITNHPVENALSLTPKQAPTLLGKETDAIIFDAFEDFDPNAFGVIAGTIRSGGVLLLLLADHQPTSLWLRRLENIIGKSPATQQITLGTRLPVLALPDSHSKTFDADQPYITADQKNAVAAIIKVVKGHRRRPLVLSSDRGRGKSAALGIAAAQLIKDKQQSIIVTAPSLATVAIVFDYTARCLPDAKISPGRIEVDNSYIKFVAPDVLAGSDEKANLLMVDEAAAILTPLLEKILLKYSRLVFATTLHGYEGTGRGFAVRFEKVLDKHTPDWRSYKLTSPIRCLPDDPLEKFIFEALLLDAQPVDDKLIADVTAEECTFEYIDREALLADETTLRQLFGLMVLAHYRTKPSDLRMMLDDDGFSIWVMRYQGQIVATAWMVTEGDLDRGLAERIHAGKRRLSGHLLPQSLAAHVGLIDAATLKYQRVIRVAVHPAVQQRNIGSVLIKNLCKESKKLDADLIGISYGATVDLLNFWQKSGFRPVRVGLKQGDCSGSHSVMMLKGLTEQGEKTYQIASKRFLQQWPQFLSRDLSGLAPEQVVAIFELLPEVKPVLSTYDWDDIHAFAENQRGFEFSQYPIRILVTALIGSAAFFKLSDQQKQILIMIALQNRSWAEVSACFGLNGKQQVLQEMRESIKMVLTGLK